MNKTKITFVLAFAVFTLIALNVFTNALIASIDNPKIVLYKNITSGEDLVFERSVVVLNENNYSVLINLEADKNLRSYLNFYENNITLSEGERKEFKYKVTLTKSGEYAGDILVTFRETETNLYLSLSQRLVMHVSEVEGSTNFLKISLYVLILVIIIAAVVVIFKIKFKSKKK